MIQDIAPSRYDIAFRDRPPAPDDYLLVMRGSDVLLAGPEADAFLPRLGGLTDRHPELAEHLAYLFCIDDRAYYLYTASAPDAPEGMAYRDSQCFREVKPFRRAFAGITACHLAGWYGRNRYCGACGNPLRPKTDERALICGHCGGIVYPNIAPAVIVAVTDGERLLMTRYANRPSGRMALVAGFVEVGETLEDTVRREVMEEVGLRVGAIRYYKSQPWAFSGSLLVGFYAELDGSPDITLDATELHEARWVERRDIPDDDTGVSLTGEMIARFRAGAEGGCTPGS